MSRERRLRRLAAYGLAEAERARARTDGVDYPDRRERLARARAVLAAFERLAAELLALDMAG